MKRKRKSNRPVHLWGVQIRHRDWRATKEGCGRIVFTTTSLWIEVEQACGDDPSIDLALSRTRAFLSRNQRQYGLPSIRKVKYRGTIDQ